MITTNLINQSDYLIFFPIIDPSLSLSAPDLKNLHLLFLKKPDHLPTNKYFFSRQKIKPQAGYLLANPQTVSYIEQEVHRANKKVAIMPFKPSAKIDYLCQKHNWLKISNDRSLSLSLEDKISFASICHQYNISAIPSTIASYTHQNIQLAKKKFSTDKIVVQTKTGWAGKSTFLADQYNPLIKGTKVKLMPYLQGKTVTINGCIFQKKLMSSPPADQLNEPKHTINIFATTGRRWPAQISPDQFDQIQNILKKIGRLFCQINYRGFFGLDFFIDLRGIVYLLECNPRLTASFDFYTQLEHKQKIDPLLYFHMIEFLDIKNKKLISVDEDRINTKLSGSQITIRDKTGKISKIITEC